jgi:DNA-binding response OmpR family regulator
MSKEIRILLIEDDAEDVELLQDALDNNEVAYTMDILKDGSAAYEFCDKITFLPDIIIMDFNLPKIHGREVIKLIRCKSRFKNIPILILSTSSSKEDMEFAYKAGADKYLTKPATIESIKETVQTILQLTHRNVQSRISV